MGKEGSTSKVAPGQEPDAIIMDDEQQWPEDAGVPEYADEYGAAGPQDLPQMVGLSRHLQMNESSCQSHLPTHLSDSDAEATTRGCFMLGNTRCVGESFSRLDSRSCNLMTKM